MMQHQHHPGTNHSRCCSAALKCICQREHTVSAPECLAAAVHYRQAPDLVLEHGASCTADSNAWTNCDGG